MREQFSRDTDIEAAEIEAYTPVHARRARPVSEDTLMGGELVALVLILLMICGPLAVGAFGR